MKIRIYYAFLSSLLFFNISIAKQVFYKSSVYGINVGEVVIEEQKGEIYVNGSTYRGVSWLYNYSFKFKSEGNNYYLFENENGKQKIYTNAKIYKKKAWLPILVNFIKFGKVDKNISSYYPFKLKITNLDKDLTKYTIIPTKSKKVKKIEFTVGKKDNFPLRIFIDGKIDITLERFEKN